MKVTDFKELAKPVQMEKDHKLIEDHASLLFALETNWKHLMQDVLIALNFIDTQIVNKLLALNRFVPQIHQIHSTFQEKDSA